MLVKPHRVGHGLLGVAYHLHHTKEVQGTQHKGREKIMQCQCENISHLKPGALSPNGNPSHKYNTEFHRFFVKQVVTEYGVLLVCRDCADDCHGGE